MAFDGIKVLAWHTCPMMLHSNGRRAVVRSCASFDGTRLGSVFFSSGGSRSSRCSQFPAIRPLTRGPAFSISLDRASKLRFTGRVLSSRTANTANRQHLRHPGPAQPEVSSEISLGLDHLTVDHRRPPLSPLQGVHHHPLLLLFPRLRSRSMEGLPPGQQHGDAAIAGS